MSYISKVALAAVLATASVSAVASEGRQAWNGAKSEDVATVSTANSGFYLTGAIGYSTKKTAQTNGTFYSVTAGPTVSTTAAGTSSMKATAKGPIFALGLGFNAAENFRTDLTWNFITGKDLKATGAINGIAGANDAFNLGEVSAQTLMLNAYFDFDKMASVTPYVTAGLGYGRIKSDAKDTYFGNKQKWNRFIWQAGLGITGEVSNNVAWDLGYRYMHLGNVKINTVTNLAADGTTVLAAPVAGGDQVIGSAKIKFASHAVMLGLRVAL